MSYNVVLITMIPIAVMESPSHSDKSPQSHYTQVDKVYMQGDQYET